MSINGAVLKLNCNLYSNLVLSRFFLVQYSCCGYNNYKDYFDPDSRNGSDNPDLIPDSCCGKFDSGSSTLKRGGCSVEAYSARPGCGDRLSRSYLYLAVPKGLVTAGNVIVIILYIIQLLAASGSFYIFVATKRQKTGGTQMVFN